MFLYGRINGLRWSQCRKPLLLISRLNTHLHKTFIEMEIADWHLSPSVQGQYQRYLQRPFSAQVQMSPSWMLELHKLLLVPRTDLKKWPSRDKLIPLAPPDCLWGLAPFVSCSSPLGTSFNVYSFFAGTVNWKKGKKKKEINSNCLKDKEDCTRWQDRY